MIAMQIEATLMLTEALRVLAVTIVIFPFRGLVDLVSYE